MRRTASERPTDVGGPIGLGVFAGWRPSETESEIVKRLRQTDRALTLLKPAEMSDVYYPIANERRVYLLAQDDQAKRLEFLAEKHNVEMHIRPKFCAVANMRQFHMNFFQKNFRWYVQSDSHIASFKRHPIYNHEQQIDRHNAKAFTSHILIGIALLAVSHPSVSLAGWPTRNNGNEIAGLNGHQTTTPKEGVFYIRNLTITRNDCPGFYPDGWAYLEDAHLCLSAHAAGATIAKFRTAELRHGASHSQKGLRQQPEYLGRLQELCDTYGVALVKHAIHDRPRGDQSENEPALFAELSVGDRSQLIA